MVFVPFIFFTGLTLYWWRKHGGLDVCVYMSALYAFTSLMAIVIVLGGMLGGGGIAFDDSDLELGIIPTLLFCVFIGFALLPFSLIHSGGLKTITAKFPLALDALCIVFIAVSFLNLYLVVDSTVEILSGDLATVRQSVYDGDATPAQIKAESLPFVVRYFYYLNACTILALPIWFYNITCRKKPWWFNALVFFSSLSMPIVSIQSADRSETMLYAMMFIFCCIFFKGCISRKIKRRLTLLSCTLAAVGVIYFGAVSIARFEEREGGTGQGLAQYAGQSYLNFCFFWEHGKFEYISPEREFPLTWHYVFDVDNSHARRSVRSGEQGFFMSIFATFLGDIMLDLSPIGMIIWTICYFMACCLFIKRGHREEMDISEVLIVFVVGLIPVFGVFSYRYQIFPHTFTIMLVLAFYILSKYKLVYK